MAQDSRGIIKEEALQNKLDADVGKEKTEVIIDGDNFVVKFIDTNRYYEVDNIGNVEIFDMIIDSHPGDITVGVNGDKLLGTETSPFEIWCIEDLIEWSQNYSKYLNSYIRLCKTLDFKSKLSYTDSERKDYGDINQDGNVQTIIEEMQTGIGFSPIQGFNGTFEIEEGKNFEIRNIYINRNGRAGFIINGKNTIIKNLKISGEIIGTDVSAGIISGDNTSYGITIINCKNYANVKGNTMVAGMCAWGREVTIQNCENYGKICIESINITYGGASGILAYGYGTNGLIEDCYNAGEIYGNYISGGIVGTGEDLEISNCSNNGVIHSIGNYANGGIIGKHRGGTVSIINCVNKATIGENSEGYAGGIVGEYIGVDYNTDRILNIYNCYNLGNILSQNYCGGILGVQGLVSLTIKLDIQNSYSIGMINGKHSAGIVGMLTNSSDRTTVTSSIKNTYWLNSSANKAIYTGNCTEIEEIESFDKTYIQSQSFCDLLNKNREENTNWKTWKLGNDGYPIFV